MHSDRQIHSLSWRGGLTLHRGSLLRCQVGVGVVGGRHLVSGSNNVSSHSLSVSTESKRTHTHTHAHTHTCMHAHTHMHTPHTQICTHIIRHTHTHMHTHTCPHRHVPIHTHTHTHTHTHRMYRMQKQLRAVSWPLFLTEEVKYENISSSYIMRLSLIPAPCLFHRPLTVKMSHFCNMERWICNGFKMAFADLLVMTLSNVMRKVFTVKLLHITRIYSVWQPLKVSFVFLHMVSRYSLRTYTASYW